MAEQATAASAAGTAAAAAEAHRRAAAASASHRGGRLIRLEVVTPSRVVLREAVEALLVPAVDGYLGILADHAPLVAGLAIGIGQYGDVGGPKRKIAISGGFIEVVENRATILADAAELAEEIDVLRAQAALERAQKRLRDRSSHIDHARAQRALLRALNRLRAAGVLEDAAPAGYGHGGRGEVEPPD